MMKTNLKLAAFAACAPLSFFWGVLMISTSYAADEKPSDLPPHVTNLDEVEPAPAVTQRKKEAAKQQTVQTIQNGEQTEVKVTNEVGTYIVKPNQSVGTSVPGDAQSSSNHAVQWVVKRWGGNNNTEPDPNAAPPALPENPTKSTKE